MIAGACGVGPNMKIDIWSDIACPWCYIGKRRLALFPALAVFFDERAKERGNLIEAVVCLRIPEKLIGGFFQLAVSTYDNAGDCLVERRKRRLERGFELVHAGLERLLHRPIDIGVEDASENLPALIRPGVEDAGEFTLGDHDDAAELVGIDSEHLLDKGGHLARLARQGNAVA